MDKSKKKRAYRSTRRQEQAMQTRLRIITAARILFIEKGYAGTPIELIAQEAGVAVETVYANFKNKRGLLSAVVDVSVVGDDLPIPLLQRPNILAAQSDTNQHQVIKTFAADVADIMGRMGPIFSLLSDAAKTEPDVADMRESLLKERLNGMAYFVEQLIRIGPLREGITFQQATETVWAVSSGEMFQLFTVDLAWEKEQYVDWLEDCLTRLLLSEPL